MMSHFVVELLNNQICLGILSGALVILPIIGIAKIHEPQNESNQSRETGNSERVPGDD